MAAPKVAASSSLITDWLSIGENVVESPKI
jgi:hypothetical protein